MVTDTGAKIQHTGNGTTTVFPFDFKVTDQAHLVVTLSSDRRH